MADVKTLVIGSGFGGAVTACRLAQAGLAPLILERGRRWKPGEFPRDTSDLSSGWLWQDNRGLMDVRPFSEVQLAMAAGYGGGSLIYGNVHLRPPQAVFAQGWPAGYDRASLDPYYDLVAHMLEIQPVPTRLLNTKAHRMREVAERLGRAEQFFLPPLAVHFSEAGQPHRNVAGVELQACTRRGACCLGCNEQAKNTLDLNYLAIAEQLGAQVRTSAEVFRITPMEGEAGYWVDYRDLEGGAEVRVSAEHVFVCGGAINSTELLLRCRDQHQSLPLLSDRLGKRYFANADAQSFIFETDEPWLPEEGPVISTSLVYSRGEDPVDVWFMIEEGGYPDVITPFVRALGRIDGVFDVRQRSATELREQLAKNAQSAAADDGVAPREDTHVACLLVMGRDLVGGQIELSMLSPDLPVLDVDWQTGENMAVYAAQERLAQDIASALGGRLVPNPMWEQLHVPISVHNLGGCGMSASPATGVTDPWGGVHHYPGLYVLDGALMPESLGVNPASTIAAIAERNVEHQIRNITANPAWGAPQRADAQPFVEPLDGVIAALPAGGSPPTRVTPLGLSFSERMAGHLLPVDAADDGPELSFAKAAKLADRRDLDASVKLTISIRDLERFLVDPRHLATVDGVVIVPGLTPPGGAPTRNGRFNLFVDGEHFYERQMRYSLPFIGVDGRPYLLQGSKEIKDDPGPDAWSDTTTLFCRVHRGHSEQGAVVQLGILRISVWDFAKQLTTFRMTGGVDALAKAQGLARFGAYFFGKLWSSYVAAKLQPGGPRADPPPPPPRDASSLKLPSDPGQDPPLPPGQRHAIMTEDGVELFLTRHQGGDKGPVILSHGAGVWSGTFVIDTTETNFARWLCARGYDVWLLDWRASIALPLRQFDLDVVARYDYVAAVAHVREVTGAASVQIVAHCIGGATLAQALSLGVLPDVRTAVISAMAWHYEAPAVAEGLAFVRIAETFAAAGIDYMSAREHPENPILHALWSYFVDAIHHGCDSTVCHRLAFMYGTPYLHQNLSPATHADLESQFGALNVRTFKHISQNLRRGHAAWYDYGARGNQDRYGQAEPPSYLDARHLTMPITLITGRQNVLWLPESIERSRDWLKASRDPSLTTCHIVEGYAHQDLFWGVDATEDVYPLIIQALIDGDR